MWLIDASAKCVCVCLHKIIFKDSCEKLILNLLKSEILKFSSLPSCKSIYRVRIRGVNDTLKTSLMIGAIYDLKTSKCFKPNFHLT